MTDDRVWTGDYGIDTWANDGPVMLALGWLLATVEPGTGPQYALDDPACWMIRDAARSIALDVPHWTHGDLHVEPLGAICHRDVALPEHTDKRAPAGTRWNATVLYERGCSGGGLVIGEYDIEAPDALPTVVIFDGQRSHHVESFTLDEYGFRLSFTVYLRETT